MTAQTISKKREFILAKRKRNRKKSTGFQHIEFITALNELCPNILGKFTFQKRCPIEINLSKLHGMPFKHVDKLWEKYGVCRIFNYDVSNDNPIAECWFPSNAIRVHDRQAFDALNQNILSFLPTKWLEDYDEGHHFMALVGSAFLQTVGEATGRSREYQTYMNSVSSIQVPVT